MAVDYRNDDKPLAVPTNIAMDTDTLTVSWDEVPEAVLYYGYITINGVQTRQSPDFAVHTGQIAECTKDGRVSTDISKVFLAKYVSEGFNGKKVKISVAVQACHEYRMTEYDSKWSDYIPEMSFQKEFPKYKTPQNVRFDGENCTLTWDNYDENASHVLMELFFEGDSVNRYNYVEEITVKGSIATANISTIIESLYGLSKLQPNATFVTIKLQAMNAYGENGWNGYADSDWSETSAMAVYNPHNQVLVESIQLSPSKMILAVGNTFAIGKNVLPGNAVYSTIYWKTADASIVGISDSGYVTGVKAGDTTISARIGLVKQTANVHVYEVKSKIADAEEKAAVIDQTGDILDDLNNNVNPDLSKIDVEKSELAETKTAIENGMERGDEFSVDVVVDEIEKEDIAADWNKVEKAAKADDVEFAASFEVEVEIHSTEKNGTDHEIANITETTTEVTFKGELPEDIPAVEEGYERTYELVRIHEDKVETIPVTVSEDGTVIAESNQFSQFVLVYSDKLTKSGWIKENGKWYYYNNGLTVKGWQKISGKWYYLDSKGVMVTGWQKVGGKWYYLDSKGVMLSGWQKISGKWYYLDSKGVMLSGWQKISGKWYYLDSKGVMATGWQKISGKWYYLDSKGVMATGWQKIGGKWYYLKGGAMVTGWQKIDGKWYYMNSGGVMLSGWQKIGGKWYYLKGGVMLSNWQKIGTKWYYFKGGIMQTGWFKSGGKWYYFNSDGSMVANTTKTIGGKKYTFDKNGVMK